MMWTEQSAYKDFVIARIEIALTRLHSNPAYMERYHQQERSEKKVDQLLQKLKKHELITIRRHYEGETVKHCLELDEAYLQGIRDCIQILSFLKD